MMLNFWVIVSILIVIGFIALVIYFLFVCFFPHSGCFDKVVKLHNSVWRLCGWMKLSPDLRINSEVNLQKTDIRDSINDSILSFNSYSFPVLSLVNFCFSILILAALVGTYIKLASLVLSLTYQVKTLTIKHGKSTPEMATWHSYYSPLLWPPSSADTIQAHHPTALYCVQLCM